MVCGKKRKEKEMRPEKPLKRKSISRKRESQREIES